MTPKPQLIEPLEARIAPALLVNGGNLLGGTGNPNVGELSTGANTAVLIKVLSGQALVFFDNGHITSISVGKHTKLDIFGSIEGDIITNLGPNGRLTDSDNNPINGEDGGILLPNAIAKVTVHRLPSGDDATIGRIIAGGGVKNINVEGEIAGIYSGNGIFRSSDTALVSTGGVDFNTVEPGVQSTFVLTKGTSTPSTDTGIKNVTVATARHLEIFAGSGLDNEGGTGGAGGTIKNVTVTKTLAAEGNKPVLFLRSGDGGAGTNGGAGGAITAFNDQGSIANVRLQTGNGGDAAGGAGGAGGSLQSSTIVTSSPRYDLFMGHGGSGDQGGEGGSIRTIKFTNNVAGTNSLVATNDFNNDGVADVVLLNSLTGESTVSLGRLNASSGATEFNAATQSNGTPFLPAQGGNPTSLVVADFNSDGANDFAVSYSATNSLGIYTGHGDGTFDATRLDLAVSPTRLAAGDFAGLGRTDLAIISSASTTTTQTGLSSQIFIAANDGAAHFTVGATAVRTLSGVVTAAVSSPVTNDLTGASLGANLFLGFKNGAVTPLLFRGGAVTTGTNFTAFSGSTVPVDALDARSFGTTGELLAFSKNINGASTADPAPAVVPQVIVYTLDANVVSTGVEAFQPDATTTTAHFVGDGNLVGTASPSALNVWSNATNAGNYTIVASVGVADGALRDFSSVVLGDQIRFAGSSAAENQFFFTSGNPASTQGVSPFVAYNAPFQPRLITFASGDGGNGDSLNGGTGGLIKGLAFVQTLDPGIHKAGGSYNVTMTTGHGGASNAGTGGSGGALQKSDVSLNPALAILNVDDTDAAVFQTGVGGQGSTGGAGGGVKKISTNTVFTSSSTGTIDPASVAVRVETGDGGVGAAAAGGAGGAIKLAGQAAFSGVTFADLESLSPFDPGLTVVSGNGGAGVTAGGAGGNLKGVGSQNAAIPSGLGTNNQLGSALVVSGNGGAASAGNGGAGGTITEANVTVASVQQAKDGFVVVAAGAGGSGTGGTGGAGGSLNKTVVGSVDGDPNRGYGVIVAGGQGGNGDAGGGAGGSVNTVQINSPTNSTLYAAVIAAGDGGDALGAGLGGAGGSIKDVKQNKDVTSTINIIQAGNGGRGAGDVGGLGGSVSGVNTSGFLGLPSTQSTNLGVFHNTSPVPAPLASLFDSANLPQGIFAGRGGSGAENGSVTNVVARQIAAISASVGANGTFAPASRVDNIKADLIGYQVDRSGSFQSSDGRGTSPALVAPVDGFILASEVGKITTLDNGRTTAFTFVA